MASRDNVAQALALQDDAEPGKLTDELFAACAAGDTDRVAAELAAGADARFQRPDSGQSALMVAAGAGHVAVVRQLLERGVPWNAQDRQERSAGDHALAGGHTLAAEELLQWACHAEHLLRTPDAAVSLAAENEAYLQQSLTYSPEEDKLLDANQEAVMMSWEQPLMAAHANLICQNGGHVLNVGFGLGLIDAAIQEYPVKSHTIIEAHPDVHAHMLRRGWGEKPNVTILFGRWQDVADQLGQYDGIFFDTYSEHYEHMQAFHALLPRILKKGGIYSFFNGLAPRCPFFHTVYCRIVADDLTALGMDTQFMELPVAVDTNAWDATWQGVRNRYWFQRAYQLPIVYWAVEDTSAAAADATEAPQQ